MKKGIFGQNVETFEQIKIGKGKKSITVSAHVITTNTKLFIYHGRDCIGMAGVVRPKDFNYEVLLRLAQHQPSDEYAVV